MKPCLPYLLSVSVALLTSSCTPKNEIVSRTQCDSAIAVATQTWEVQYSINKTSGGLKNQRTVPFQSNTLTNHNGEKPPGAASGPDDNGIWWAALPPRPTADEVDQFHQSGELHDPPQLQRSVEYQLRCEDGTLFADARTYREAARTIRAQKTVPVTYSLNRVLKVEPSAANTPDARSPERSQPAPKSERLSTTLYVDPQQGQDNGDGSQAQPLKTITAALKQAGVTTIQLRPGTYDASSGETFPLQLEPGMTLRGNSETQGNGVVIQGGGSFLSPTWAQQNVTIVAVKGTQVQGVTVTNRNLRGTAIWVEAGNPTIAGNSLVNNHREGVFVSGSATPIIRNNRFEQNGGNGISFTRDSAGIAESNIIRSSGFGMAIGDRASPEVHQNQIVQNQDGLVINGAARPALRQNTIANNQRDGIVVVQAATPRLQQNYLSQNGQFDLNNATNRPLQLADSDLVGLKVQGQ